MNMKSEINSPQDESRMTEVRQENFWQENEDPIFLPTIFLPYLSGLVCLLASLLTLLPATFANAQEPRTFTLKAPDAKAVEFRKLWDKPVPMTRGDDGVWTVTPPAFAPGVYEYTFVVDGKNTPDPANPVLRPALNAYANVLEVPGKPPRVWNLQDVPHGKVTPHSYESKSLGKTRNINVYTPPGYDKDAATKYPVLILLPAEMDSHDTWVAFGKVDRIMDNQIAAGKAVPMVVLMVDGHPLGITADLKAKAPGRATRPSRPSAATCLKTRCLFSKKTTA